LSDLSSGETIVDEPRDEEVDTMPVQAEVEEAETLASEEEVEEVIIMVAILSAGEAMEIMTVVTNQLLGVIREKNGKICHSLTGTES
jgi:hypothetical protein